MYVQLIHLISTAVYVPINDSPKLINIEENPKTKNGFLKFLKAWHFPIIILIIISLAIGGFYSYFAAVPQSDGSTSAAKLDNGTTSSDAYTPRKIYLPSPLNGELLPQDSFSTLNQRKVLTVIIENLAGPNGARPQAGLQDADIVYETLAEGNITRFMGIFWNKTDDIKLMPIRSARKYFLDWLQEYNDPLFMHIGQAESDNEATNALGALSKYNIKDLTGAKNSFDRDHVCEKSKAVEHCAFSSTNVLWSAAKDRGWTTGGSVSLSELIYKDDLAVDPEAKTTVAANKVHVEFEDDPDNYAANWTYDKATNTYLRSIGKTPHTDQLTGKQLFTKTLIVQKTDISVSEDHGKYHKVIKTVGSGDAWVIQDGKAVAATWKKDALKTRTRYYDKTTGKELSLDRGKMWITVTGNAPDIS